MYQKGWAIKKVFEPLCTQIPKEYLLCQAAREWDKFSITKNSISRLRHREKGVNDLAYFMFLRVLDLETPSLFSFLFFFCSVLFQEFEEQTPLVAWKSVYQSYTKSWWLLDELHNAFFSLNWTFWLVITKFAFTHRTSRKLFFAPMTAFLNSLSCQLACKMLPPLSNPPWILFQTIPSSILVVFNMTFFCSSPLPTSFMEVKRFSWLDTLRPSMTVSKVMHS